MGSAPAPVRRSRSRARLPSRRARPRRSAARSTIDQVGAVASDLTRRRHGRGTSRPPRTLRDERSRVFERRSRPVRLLARSRQCRALPAAQCDSPVHPPVQATRDRRSDSPPGDPTLRGHAADRGRSRRAHGGRAARPQPSQRHARRVLTPPHRTRRRSSISARRPRQPTGPVAATSGGCGRPGRPPVSPLAQTPRGRMCRPPGAVPPWRGRSVSDARPAE